jgi:hypothetical protein
MTFGRLVVAIQAHEYSLIRPRWITNTFVTGDVLSFFIQAGGAGILAKAKSASDTSLGEHIIVGGLIFQIVMFAVFMFVALHFNKRYKASSPPASSVPWQGCLYMLYLTSLLIMGRNIFRVVQYVMGGTGYLLVNEWPTYVFDGAFMLLTMGWFYLRYPPQLSMTKTSTTVSADEEAGLEMASRPEEHAATRPSREHRQHRSSRAYAA